MFLPDGFIICNGQQDTPDLRDQFIVAAGDTYAVDETGGVVVHTHFFEDNLHSHDFDKVGADVNAGASIDSESTAEEASGSTDNTSSLPPFYALVFLMKL